MVFDIAQMGEQIRAVDLQVILEYVWQRVVANKRRGVRTWVWIDEFSIMFNDGAGRTTHTVSYTHLTLPTKLEV